MAVNTVYPAGNLATTDDTDRGPSRAVWYDCPRLELISDSSKGVYLFDDFLDLPKTPATTEGNFGRYSQFSSSGGTINAGTGQGGEWVLGEATDNEGASFRTRSVPFKLSRDTKQFWFEARVKSSTITDNQQGFFIGLTDDTALTATSPITAAGALADLNLVGFLRAEGDGDQIDTVYKADGVTAVTVQADALNTALVADTYVKLGMRYVPTADIYNGTTFTLAFFANGRRLTTTKQLPSAAGTDFPNDVALGLAFAMLLGTAASLTATIDWWSAAQVFYP